MFKNKWLLGFLPFLVVLLPGCSNFFTVDYEIHNATSGQIYTTYDSPDTWGTSSNVTSPDTYLRIYQYIESGCFSKEEIIATNLMPVENLLVTNERGDTVNLDVTDINNWNVTYNESDEAGLAILYINNNDFK